LSLAGTGREQGWLGTGLWEAGTDGWAGLGTGLTGIGPETWRQTGWWEELGTGLQEELGTGLREELGTGLLKEAESEQAAEGLVMRKQER